MLGSVALEVAVGLAYVYLLLSLICLVLNEWVAGVFALRARTLKVALGNLLDDPGATGLVGKLYGHPLLQGLSRAGARLPSYIPSGIFATALLDIVAPTDPAAGPRSVQQIRDSVSKLPPGRVRDALLPLIDHSENDLTRARLNIESWFNDAMDRASGWYKRMVHTIVLCLAIGVTILFNADTFAIANGLGRNPVLLASVAVAAQTAAKQPLPTAGQPAETRVVDFQSALRALQLPLGWSRGPGDPRAVPTDFWGWVGKLLGLLFTAVAVSLGAPFWFDFLGKLVNLRAAGPRPAGPSQRS